MESVLRCAHPLWCSFMHFSTSYDSLFIAFYFLFTQILCSNPIGMFMLHKQRQTCHWNAWMPISGWHDDEAQIKEIHLFMFFLWLKIGRCICFTCAFQNLWQCLICAVQVFFAEMVSLRQQFKHSFWNFRTCDANFTFFFIFMPTKVWNLGQPYVNLNL